MRLDRYMILASIGMKKEVGLLIRQGVVMVNDQVVTIPETEIDEVNDSVFCNGEKIKGIEKKYYMFYKPAGCITARSDVSKETVLDYFHEIDARSLFPVGRLDKDTEGLLFLTNDGEFDHLLMNPKHHVDKKYFFWALGSLSEEEQDAIRNGLSIGEGEKITKPAKLEILKTGKYAELKEEIKSLIVDQVRVNPNNQEVVAGYLTISEGRKHQVKRMLKAVGCYVIYLKREAIGEVELDGTIQKGEYRELTKGELDSLLL